MANILLILNVIEIDSKVLPSVDSRGISSDRIKIVIDRGTDRLIRIYDPKSKVNTEYIVTNTYASINSQVVDLIEINLLSIEGITNTNTALINAENSIKSCRDITGGNEVIYNFGDTNNEINQTLLISENVAALKVLVDSSITPGLPGGADTEVQYNNGGLFGGDSAFTWDNILKKLGIGTGISEASAKLEINSTTQGLLPPRMTDAQMELIGTPANGLGVHTTDTSGPHFFNGVYWEEFTPDLNLERTIRSFDDWADTTSPGGGCVVTATTITLEANFTYKISGLQDSGGRTFICNGKNMFYGTSNSDGVFRTTAGFLIEVNIGDIMFINLLSLRGGGLATLWDANGSGTPADQILVVASEISDFASMGTVNNLGVLRFEANLFFGLADGVLVTGTGFLIDYINNSVTIDSGTFLDLGTSVNLTVEYRGQAFNSVASGATLISGAANSANIAVGGGGQMLGNTFTGDGDYLGGGLTKDDERWNYQGNLGGKGTENSKVVGSIIMENNTTETVISVIGETFMVSAYADAGGGDTTVTTSVAHGLGNGVDIWIVGTVAYDGQYVTANASGSVFDIVVAFVTDEATGTAETGWEEILGTTTARIARRISQTANSQMTFNNLEISNTALDVLCGVLLVGGGNREVQTGIFKNNARCFGSLGDITTSTNITSTHSKCLDTGIATDVFDARVRNLETTANIIVKTETFTANE